MAQLLDGAGKLGWVLLKSVFRFVFMFFNNCVAIPSYCLYLLLLQPLRIWDSSTFWRIEGIMFKWLLAMVSSWGWIAGYTGNMVDHSYILPLFHLLPCTHILFCTMDLMLTAYCWGSMHTFVLKAVELHPSPNLCFMFKTQREGVKSIHLVKLRRALEASCCSESVSG